MRAKQTRSNFLLLITALIWGSAFVAQSAGMDYLGPFTFTVARSFIGGAFLLPCIAFLDKLGGRKFTLWGSAQTPAQRKTLVLGGVVTGIILAIAGNFQQFGIQYTTVAKAGFITTLYIIIVPLLGLLARKKVGGLVWCGVGLAALGMYLLCMTDGFSVSGGDFLVLLCACMFSLHILAIDHFSSKVDCVRMACIQFFVCGLVSSVPMAALETPTLPALAAAWLPLLYAGVLSSGVGYTLQVVAQKDTSPTVASLIMSLESVFAALAGWVLLGQTLTVREGVGCLLVFAAILLAQLPQKKNAAAKP